MKHVKHSPSSEFGRLLLDVIQQLVDYPEDAEVREIVGAQVSVFEVFVRQSDHGKLIGRAGANIEAVRHLAMCRGGRDGRRFKIEVLEDPVAPSERHPLSTHPTHTLDPVAVTTALLARILQNLVDDPELVQVRALRATATAVFEVEVAPSDIRKILGRQGRTADALRRLLTGMGRRESRRYLLSVVEPA